MHVKDVLAKLPFEGTTGRLVRTVRRRSSDQMVKIATYHSVSSRPSFLTDEAGLRHDPAEFELHLDYLTSHYQIISLRELVERLRAGRTVRHAVVLTFDDGYADNLRVAYPILYRRRLPMTVFPVAGVIGNEDLLWQHKLCWLIAEGHQSTLEEAMLINGYPPRTDCDSLELHARRSFRADLPALLEEVLQSVGQSGRKLAGRLRPYIEVEDIEQADSEFLELGNHTMTHPVLSALPPQRQLVEIADASKRIHSLTGQTPIAIAYPFGLKQHYTADSRRCAKDCGLLAALDLRRRVNRPDVDPMDLSRFPVPHASQEDFERAVEDWPLNSRRVRTGNSQ
jgi:peptidoglycan/xylan/chitin deacetylase (PgdA/CDA1 family)